MIDGIFIVLAMVIIVLAWNKFSKALDWVGERVGETSDILSDITVSGAKQTARGVVLSHDSLMDTIQDSVEKEANRQVRAEKFKEKLKDDQKKNLEAHESYLNKFKAR